MRRIHTRDDYPLFHDAFGAFVPYFQDFVLDPCQALDEGIGYRVETGQLAELEAEVRRMLDGSPDEESARENLMDLLSQTGVPEGGGYRDWLQGVHKRVLEAIRDPAPFLEEAPEEDGREPARLGEFHRKSEAAVWEVVDPVLDAHDRQFEEWMTDRGGLYRQHYYLPDVGQQSGRVVMDFDAMERIPVRGAGVLVRWDARENKLVLDDLHPE
ncbi:MAG: hypothetical protein ACLGIA_09550, partial [Actinomycetes bacterium]